jgi:sulfur-oxidizing protein SoxA
MNAAGRVVAIALLALAGASVAQEIKPGSAFLSPQMQRQQEDEASRARNCSAAVTV